MGPISLREARARFSDLIRAAELGETVIITRHGKIVARLEPPDAATAVQKAPPLNAFRASLQSKGKPLSRIVIDERNESRY
jgi:prevent-host-death family protein